MNPPEAGPPGTFTSIYSHNFARVAAGTVPVTLADPASNAAQIRAAAQEAHDDGVALLIFPELTLTGYSIEDLLLQTPVSDAVENALTTLTEETRDQIGRAHV